MQQYPKIKDIEYCQVLGSGAFSQVVLCRNEVTGMKYAMKIIDASKMISKKHHISNEINVLRTSNHKNVIKLYNVYEFDDTICLLMEYIPGGELLEQIEKNIVYTEDTARQIIYEILSTVEYLHSHDIVHRDLKPENILLSDASEITSIKIADFGLACNVKGNKMLSTLCGSVYFMAPEIIVSDAYDGKCCDMWSIGIISFLLLCGRVPFDGPDTPTILAKVIAGCYEYEENESQALSEQTKSFISGLLQPKPHNRLTAQQALAHEFLKDENFRSSDPIRYQSIVDMRECGSNIAESVTRNLKQMNKDPKSIRKNSNIWETLKAFGKKVKGIRPRSRQSTPSVEAKEFKWDTRGGSQASSFISQTSSGLSMSSSDYDSPPSITPSKDLSDASVAFEFHSLDRRNQRQPTGKVNSNQNGNSISNSTILEYAASEPISLLPPPQAFSKSSRSRSPSIIKGTSTS